MVDRWTYDAADRLDTLTWGREGGAALDSIDYGRDAEGMITSQAMTAGTAKISAEATTIAYDPRDQFVSTNGTAPGPYSYDDNGSLIQSGDTFNAYDAAGQLDKTTHEITLVGTAKAFGTATKSVRLTLPSPTRAGDQIVLTVVCPDSTNITGGSAGYTLVKDEGVGAGGARIQVFRKTATSSGGTVTLQFSSGSPVSASAMVYRGVDPTNPVAASSSVVDNNSPRSLTLPSINAPIAGSKLVLSVAADGPVLPSATAPAGMSERIALSGQTLSAVGGMDQTLARAGQTGPRTVGVLGCPKVAAVMLVLTPLYDVHHFDDRGNRTASDFLDGSTRTFGYDQANRLMAVNGAGGYAYNAEGLRTEVKVSGTATHHSWSDASGGLPLLLTETPRDVSGQLRAAKTTSYIYGPAGRLLTRIDPRPDVTLVGTTSATNAGTANSLSVNLPAGVQRNDQVLLVTTYNSKTKPTTPSGYTQLGTMSAGPIAETLWRRSATDSEPGSVTISYSNTPAAAKSAELMVYRGIDPQDPVVDIQGASAQGTEVTVPALVTGATGNKVVGFAGASPTVLTTPAWTAPGGHVVRVQNSTLGTAIIATDAAQTPVPGTDPLTFRFSGSAPLVAGSISLRQAPASERWYHTDQLGSTRLVTDNYGHVTSTASYTPYGAIAGSTGEPIRLGYAGQYQDPSGLIYLRSRYLDPSTQQFLTRDPIVWETHEAYGYSGNDPINASDPNGLCPVCVVLIGAGIGAASDLLLQAGTNWLMGCPAFSNINWGDVVLSGLIGAATAGYGNAAKAGSTGARATVHGSERLTQAGFTDDLIAQTRAGLATRQSDGANVFVREVTPGRFDFIVEGERGVVTAHRGWSQKSVDRLAKNYGWEGWPP